MYQIVFISSEQGGYYNNMCLRFCLVLNIPIELLAVPSVLVDDTI